MVYLKFYGKEREEFGEAYSIMIPTQRGVVKIVNKLIRHFKMRPVTVIFEKRKPGTGSCWSESRYMSFHKSDCSIGIICHEVGHQFHYDQTGKKGHSKKLMTRIRRLNNYCRKMGFWGLS
jgi:hypothetical protein